MKLDYRRIQKMVPGVRVHFAPEMDSTNEWAKRDPFDEDPSVTDVFFAETQTAGKGSRGRGWDSPPGESVFMSIRQRSRVPNDRLSMVTLVMGMAAAEGLRISTGLSAGIKWPNDVVSGGKKLCGILTEYMPEPEAVVIGIGLNLNNTSFPDEIREKATSVYLETGKTVSRETAAAEVIRSFIKYERVFRKTYDFSNLKKEYEAMLVNLGKKVRVLDPEDPFDGEAGGIDGFGRLLVRRDDTGRTEHVYAGEVSVRGVYGYV